METWFDRLLTFALYGILLTWLAFENRKRPLLLFGLSAIFLNKFCYYLVWHSYTNWIITQYFGHVLVLIIMADIVRQHGVSTVPMWCGLAALIVVFSAPYIIDLPPISWYTRYEMPRIAMYISLIALLKVPRPEINGRVLQVITEPAKIATWYIVILIFSDFAKAYKIAVAERYALEVIDPTLFMIFLLVWGIGIYYRRDRGYANEID